MYVTDYYHLKSHQIILCIGFVCMCPHVFELGRGCVLGRGLELASSRVGRCGLWC